MYLPWGEYGPGGKVELMISSGEEFDTFLGDKSWMMQLLSKEMILDVTDLADQYLPDLKQVVAEEAFDYYTVDGRLYSVPIGNKPQSDYFLTTSVRQDLLGEVGMSTIETMDDLTEFATKVKEKYPDMYATPDFEIRNYIRGLSDKELTLFTDLNNTIVVDQNNPEELTYVYESEIYATLCAYARQWYELGMTPVELMTNTSGNSSLFETGRYCWWRGASLTTETQNLPALQENVPTGQIKEYSLNPEKPKYRYTFCNTNFLFPATAVNPDRAVMLINYMQQSTENTDFLTFGVEGTDYNLLDNKIDRICTDTLFPDWMLLNVNLTHFATSYPDEWIERYRVWDDDYKVPVEIFFSIDLEPIETEVAKVNAVIEERFKPITYGYVSYEEGYESALADLKAAGIDTIMDEVQRQWTEYLASQE